MATRGQIAYLANPNTIFSLYNHYDSYPDHLGKALNTHFNSDSEAEDLVMNGNDVRFIDDDGTVERFDKGSAYEVKGETPEDLFNYLYDHADGSSADYVYVWLDDKWVTLPMIKGRRYFVGTLLDSIRKMESTLEGVNEAKDIKGHVMMLLDKLESKLGKSEKDNFTDYQESVMRDIKAGGTRLGQYEEFDIDAMEEDYKNYIADKMDLDEIFVRQMKYRAGIIK